MDTVEQLVGGMAVNKIVSIRKGMYTAVSQGYKVIVSNRCKHGQGVLLLKQYIEKDVQQGYYECH